MPMRAAEHFALGEELLANSKQSGVYSSAQALTLATQARAHFDAARLLLDTEQLRRRQSALSRSGMDDVIDVRHSPR